MPMTKIINVAEVRKTYNTIGEVRYLMVFQVSEGYWTIERHQTTFKSEKSALKKLNALKAKYMPEES